jgi:hypothetical protein
METKMKKTILMTLIILTLLLGACSSASNSTDEPASAQEATAIAEVVSATLTAAPTSTLLPTETAPATLSTAYPEAVPVQLQLIVGTLQLEGSQMAVTAAQASALLPVWTALKDLGGNSAATQEQYDDLIERALQAMTNEQIQAIALMQITRQQMMTVMQQQGISLGGPGNGMGQGGAGGQPPQGTPPAGDAPQGIPPGGGQTGTPPANGSQGVAFLSVPPELLDAFIQFLEQKASA